MCIYAYIYICIYAYIYIYICNFSTLMNKLSCHLSVSHFAGHLAYLAAVRVDAAYNNPVMNVFVYLLSQGTTSHKSTST